MSSVTIGEVQVNNSGQIEVDVSVGIDSENQPPPLIDNPQAELRVGLKEVRAGDPAPVFLVERFVQLSRGGGEQQQTFEYVLDPTDLSGIQRGDNATVRVVAESNSKFLGQWFAPVTEVSAPISVGGGDGGGGGEPGNGEGVDTRVLLAAGLIGVGGYIALRNRGES